MPDIVNITVDNQTDTIAVTVSRSAKTVAFDVSRPVHTATFNVQRGYINPGGTPAAHTHDAADIVSGRLAALRLPEFYKVSADSNANEVEGYHAPSAGSTSSNFVHAGVLGSRFTLDLSLAPNSASITMAGAPANSEFIEYPGGTTTVATTYNFATSDRSRYLYWGVVDGSIWKVYIAKLFEPATRVAFLGEITPFAGSVAPAGWDFCNGQILTIASNPALFAVIGNAYGGDGIIDFALPDLRGRLPMHAGQGTGLSARALGDVAGEEVHTISISQLPAHTHDIKALKDSNNPDVDPTGKYLGEAQDDLYEPTQDVNMAPTGSTGNGDPVNHMPPFAVVNYIIATQGINP